MLRKTGVSCDSLGSSIPTATTLPTDGVQEGLAGEERFMRGSWRTDQLLLQKSSKRILYQSAEAIASKPRVFGVIAAPWMFGCLRVSCYLVDIGTDFRSRFVMSCLGAAMHCDVATKNAGIACPETGMTQRVSKSDVTAIRELWSIIEHLSLQLHLPVQVPYPESKSQTLHQVLERLTRTMDFVVQVTGVSPCGPAHLDIAAL